MKTDAIHMTDKERKMHDEAVKTLYTGSYYLFSTPIEADGISVVFSLQPLHFSRGLYLGQNKEDGSCIFQGRPQETPSGCDPNFSGMCFFHVLFTGGVSCQRDPNQKSR